MAKFRSVLWIFAFFTLAGLWNETWGIGRHKHNRQGRRFLIGHNTVNSVNATNGPSGSWPSVFNLATKAKITTNATCGASGREEFCREHNSPRGRSAPCSICDAHSPDLNKRHPIEYAIDGNNNHWWQSPSLAEGVEFEYIAITMDLGQEYEVAYVIVRAGASPRPAAWALEHSTDGDYYQAWQYFARSSSECQDLFGVPATPGKPRLINDVDPTCTTFHSKQQPHENGEIHLSLMGGSDEWSKSRYVRLRLMGLHGERSGRPERRFYTLRDLTVGGRCSCAGHAKDCRHNVARGHPECECIHHTCGPSCNKCCPMFNQLPFSAGTLFDPNICQSCQCHGHANECIYDAQVDEEKRSIDIYGRYRGGGVCINCKKHTAGINCEMCEIGYYRPPDVLPEDDEPCVICDCDPNGSTGQCLYDEYSQDVICECKEGYIGSRCNRCDSGYNGYPLCELCPCNKAGTLFEDECDADCECKLNVYGKHCDTCREGFFSLEENNPDGCMPCYCSGIGETCRPTLIENHILQSLENWTVTDMRITATATPTLDSETGYLTIADYEFSGFESYYWNAPDVYLGSKLQAYGSLLIFRIGWVVIRGDTSGKPTTGPNLIMIGHNGMKIAIDDISYPESNDRLEITIPLREHLWYHMPDSLKDIVTRSRRTEYIGAKVTRKQFMSVLANVKNVLLRAKFHTDQVEGNLEGALIVVGNENIENQISHVEKCVCPPGYTGYSCEICAFGYVKIFTNTTNHYERFECIKCKCNGHAESCDLNNGECSPCQHNTIGLNCERCVHGYYGNPLIGNVDDCKKCACPLLVESNNFSPSCTSEEDKYFCTQCPEGYTGDHCEICDYGYYGNPLEIGSTCQVCNCNGAPCNNVTGECLTCPGNTDGYKCDSCKENHYGIASEKDCKPCDCDMTGSTSITCNPNTGKCDCRYPYDGRACNSCQKGYGNFSAGCMPCECDMTGSLSPVCDPIVGHCECKTGVEGFRCDSCQYQNYGFSTEGCLGCKCNERGSEMDEKGLYRCDIITGQCRCLPHVVGLTCDQCESGYWGLSSGRGCSRCDCDAVGTQDGSCDIDTGKCTCRPGIGGKNCDTCLSGYYGFSNTGCLRCKTCSEGQFCDPDTGRCICPPLAQGSKCKECRPGSYGLDPLKGCKYCNCSMVGSVGSQCDPIDGQCVCQEGFEGSRCDECASNYYGYPRCRPCACNYAGTLEAACDRNDKCVCDKFGQCPCKSNVVGLKCNECKNGTFGLSSNTPSGCTQCFCFGRTSHCTQAGLTWGHIRLTLPRLLLIDTNVKSNKYGSRINQIAISSLGDDLWYLPTKGLDLNVTSGLTLIPDTEKNVTIDSNDYLPHPLYWSLPKKFLGDRITSYGGFLKFKTESNGISERISNEALMKYPLVQIHAQGILVLEYYQIFPSMTDTHHVRFHESLWKLKESRSSIDRTTMMVALQNIDAIYLRGSHYSHLVEARLSNVSMDTAISIGNQLSPLASGVELCSCPHQYNSTSCQDASIGFYIPPNKLVSNASGTIIIQLIAKAQQCECNDRSEQCHKDTGHCFDCRENTAGPYCDRCAEGYHGDPWGTKGCQPCPCPHIARNHATSCNIRGNRVTCQCKKGYSGNDCSSCARGWWLGNDGKCRQCECDGEGVIKSIHGGKTDCHPTTGQCPCHEHVTGMRCDSCITPRNYLEGSMCVPCDNCSQILLDKIEVMTYELGKDTEHLRHGSIPKPWIAMYKHSNETVKLSKQLADLRSMSSRLRSISPDELDYLQKKMIDLSKQVMSTERNLNEFVTKALNFKEDQYKIFDNLMDLRKNLEDRVRELEDFSRHEKHLNVKKSIKTATLMMDKIKKLNFSEFMKNVQDVSNMVTLNSTTIKEYTYQVNDHLNKVDKLKNDFKNWLDKIKDIDGFIKETSDMISNIDIPLHKERINQIQEINKKINSIYEHIVVSYNENPNRNSMVVFQEAEDDILNLRKFQIILGELSNRTEVKGGILSRINPEYEDKYVMLAQNHVDNITNLVERYKTLLKETESNTTLALTASSAYNDIIQTLRSAKKDALDALSITEMADQITAEDFPSFDDRNKLSEISEEYVRQSNRLLERASHEDSSIALNLEKTQRTLTTLQAIIRTASYEQRNISNKIESTMKNDNIKSELLAAQNKIQTTYNRIKGELLKGEEMQRNITYKLNIDLENLKSSGDDKIGKAEEKISLFRGDLNRAKELASSLMNAVGQRQNEMKNANNSLLKDLQLLKSQIQRAKHAANAIHVSIQSSPNTGCSRSYFIPNLNPSTYSQITATLSLTPNNVKDSTIFNLPSSISNDFIKLELVNKKIKFSWNLGSDTAFVIHPTILEIYSDESSDGSWYKVDATRTSNTGTISVRRVTSDLDPYYPKLPTNMSNPSHGILDVKATDLAWIGAVNEEKNHGLPGCLHKLSFNGKEIGLWNFKSQSIANGCKGGFDGAEESRGSNQNMFYWNGAGYSVLQRSNLRPYNKNQFSILLTFKTFDENALLFLAVDEANNRSVSLQLQEGRVVFRIDYTGESRLEINTTEKYNTGKVVEVQAARIFIKRKIEKGSLKVNGYEQLGSPNPAVINSQSLPDLGKSDYFLGGIPPLWKTMPLSQSLPPSFLGCLGEVNIDQEGYNPMESIEQFGIETSCTEKHYYSVGFYGDGYLKIPSHTLRKKSYFGFMFRTTASNAFLLLSAPYSYQILYSNDAYSTTNSEMGIYDEPIFNNEGYFSVSLVDGKIHLLMNAGKGDLKLVSNMTTLNDGHFHSVTVIKNGRKIELLIDDNLKAVGSLPPGSVVVHSSPQSSNDNLGGGLFLGGVPSQMNESDVITQYIASTIPLYGAIKDITLDGKIMSMDSVIHMHHAFIGRLGPSMGEELDIDAGLLNTQQSEFALNKTPKRCHKVNSYTLELGAVKFGDVAGSYAQVHLTGGNTWQHDFSLEFDFRTYYPNGLLLYLKPYVSSKGKQKRHTVSIFLRNGKITLLIKFKKHNETEMVIPFVANDGLWHRVSIKSRQKRLSVTVGSRSGITQMPRNFVMGNTIYIGGLPIEKSAMLKKVPDKILRIDRFKGCIRRMTINGKQEDLVKNPALHRNVGQCFPTIEMGSYFPGDAYAIYDNKFVLNSHLELRLEFRTVEMNGVLLSVARNNSNAPALSLELRNAKIVMSVLTSSGNRFSVETSLPNPFGLCDNTWHNISAVFSTDELTVRVDQQPAETDLGKNMILSNTTPPSINQPSSHAPFYIGGLPDGEPTGTLSIKDNFKGCIKNVLIQGHRKDWTDMDYLHNILLSSCPVQ